ncbi:MAG: hypothetical protein EOO50_09975 [Flavobacterium sp.]|nr:MAG: hypothetical protein EOO50_09975 [Flavobacterium sp.]
MGELPKELKETSACDFLNGKIWTTEDHGNAAKIYAIDRSGQLKHTLTISGVHNNDWEELSSDEAGNIYIGDFGNNDNERRDLTIFKIDAGQLGKEETRISAKTTFSYPDQKDFPPKKSQRIFDCESFFVSGDYFYLFSKNRSSSFDGTTILYRVPNKPGNFEAEKISEFKTCGNYNRCAVTGADISPNGKKVALLTSDKVFLFEDFKSDDFFSGKSHEIALDHFSQKEGIGFASDDELLITDEKDKKTGGNLYSLDLKAKP